MTIYIAPAVYRSLNIRTAASLQRAYSSPPPGETILWESLWGDALIARARSVLATKFLKETNADVMVIVDDDIVFEPEDLWKIVQGARKTKGIFAGTYVTHGAKPHVTCRSLPGAPEFVFKKESHSNPIEVEYVGTGFMAVHRDVMEAMLVGEYEDADGPHRLHECVRGSEYHVMIPFFDTMTIEEAPGVFHYLSEDWAFCERARQLGFRVWVDQSIILEHMGEHAQSVLDINGAGMGTNRVLISVPVTGEAFVDCLPEDLAEWSGQSIESIFGALREGTYLLGKSWIERKVPEEEWYKLPEVGAEYALDLANWQIYGGGVEKELIPLLKGKKVLDFGAGIGTVDLMALRDGAESVTYYEVNPWLVEFTQWRAKKYNLPLNISRDTKFKKKFDAIICWHVFEHVIDPEGVLRELKSSLTPEGILITQSDFHNDDDHPMHHEIEEDWEEILGRNGFKQIEPNVYKLQ